jgi:hypothetical protein
MIKVVNVDTISDFVDHRFRVWKPGCFFPLYSWIMETNASLVEGAV